MEYYGFIDIYATKGIEYLIVIGFLASFVLFCRILGAPWQETAVPPAGGGVSEWFRVPDGLLYHLGHSWARAGDDGLVTVGVDDFAQKLVGRPEGVDLPPLGTRLAQGKPGWHLRVDSRPIPMLSPVDGEVAAVNPEAARDPGIVNRAPYGEGWLLKIRPSKLAANRRSLFSGHVAREWIRDELDQIRCESGAGLGPVYQDGGTPVSGLARALAGEQWEERVRDYFRTG